MPKTLLLADDSVVIQKLVGLSLANQDVELITADNGDDAIALATRHRPDAVIADVIMPGRSGYEVCEAIVQDPALTHIPVLLLTGTFEAFDEQRAQDVGAVGHITKPFEAQALVERVAELFSGAPLASPAVARPAAAPAPGSQTVSDSAFDFFEDDITDPSRPPIASEPLAEALASPNAAAGVEFDPGLLGNDRTLAVVPGDPSASPFELELDGSAPVRPVDLFDVRTQGESDWLAPPAEFGTFAEPAADDAPPGSETTLLAGDLFDSTAPAAAPGSPIREAARDGREHDTLWTEPAEADFDLSASDLAAVSPGIDPAEVLASPAAQSLGASHGLEATSQAPAHAVSTAARESLHETLEKVAWEAFSELSEQVVRQVLERVETIAWEVIPQLTETLVREEIRRIKGEDES